MAARIELPLGEDICRADVTRVPTIATDDAGKSDSVRGWRLLTLGWIVAIATGSYSMMAYEFQPGTPAAVLPAWPDNSSLLHDTSRWNLVLTAHPHCSCTRASLSELAQIVHKHGSQLSIHVLFVKPAGTPENWERSSTWQEAEALAQSEAGVLSGARVHVVSDRAGQEAERFGAATSGQVLLFDSQGRLRFSGGLTSARGMAGDGPARRQILAVLEGGFSQALASTPVFGCPVFNRTREPR